MSNTVIRVENLSKMYHLGTIGYGTLQDDLKAWWAHVRGKEDPNTQIGKQSRIGQHGEFWALRDVSFDIQQGDRVGIIGRNGAGKSTLLKILSKITAPTEGCIKVKGRIASLLEVGTGFHGELTGRENIFLNGAILGMKRREIQRKFDEIVDFAGVSAFVDTPVKRYSSGMFVRLAFSVAAHLDADILIVDEVLAVGDAEFQKKAINRMEEISAGEGKTVFFVSHNMSTLEKLCQKGIYLKEGKMITYSSIPSIIPQYLLEVSGKSLVASEGRVEYEPHQGKLLYTLSVSTSNAEKEVQKIFNVNEKIIVDCKFKVIEVLHGITAYISVKRIDTSNQDAIIVFDTDECGEKMAVLKTGDYNLVFTIPEYILGVGKYQVYYNFTGKDTVLDDQLSSPRESVVFEVLDITTKRGSSRGSILSLLPKVDIHKIQ